MKKSCSCQFYFLEENELDMWNDRGHLNIYLNNDTVIYKEAAQSSDIGVIIISDTMGKCKRYVKKTKKSLVQDRNCVAHDNQWSSLLKKVSML